MENMATQLFIIIPYYHVHTSKCSNINRYLGWCISSYLEARVVWLFSLEEKMRKRIMSHKVSILVLFHLLLLCYFVVVGSFLSKIKFVLFGFWFYEPPRIVFLFFFPRTWTYVCREMHETSFNFEVKKKTYKEVDIS